MKKIFIVSLLLVNFAIGTLEENITQENFSAFETRGLLDDFRIARPIVLNERPPRLGRPPLQRETIMFRSGRILFYSRIAHDNIVMPTLGSDS